MAVRNAFVVKGADAEIHSDSDQDGDVTGSEDERRKRYWRPGAIILPNLNLSEGLPAGGLQDLSDKRDADDDQIQGMVDIFDLALFKVLEPPTRILADEVILHVDDADLNRFRVFQFQGVPLDPDDITFITSTNDVGAFAPPENWNAVFGATGGNDFPIDVTVPDWSEIFLIEALTFPGCPTNPGPGGATPPPPPNPPFNVNAQGEGVALAQATNPIYNPRGPGEVWVELIHKKGGAPMPNNGDVALFLIAPFLLQSNVEPCERVYVCLLRDTNHDFVYDLMEGCWEAFGAGGPFDRDSWLPFDPSEPSDLAPPEAHNTTAGQCTLSPRRLYVINGWTYPDEWVQDQFEMGYCSAPGQRAFNVAVQCKRNRDLQDFVKQELAHEDVALFNELQGTERDGMDYGGNIEVSPPVPSRTDQQPGGAAGPAVPAHDKAPFGKILLGDHENTDRPDPPDLPTSDGKVHDETRTFLQAQGIQPIIPINTSWLGVGHIDEIMSFVPANTDRGSCLLIASVYMMDRLLRKIKEVSFGPNRSHFHRGKFEHHRGMIGTSLGSNALGDDPWIRTGLTAAHWGSYAEISAEALNTGPIGIYSRDVWRDLMIPIEKRLMDCTAHRRADVIKVPIYFKPVNDATQPYGHPENQTVAETVGMVNMQVVNGHLMVPKPFGPRMPRAQAAAIVRSVLGGGIPVQHVPGNGFPFWAWPGLDLDRVAQIFARPATAAARDEIIEKIKDPAHGLSVALDTLVNNTKNDIIAANPVMPLDANDVFNGWMRLHIPENTVDVIETYMLSALSHIGRQVHFVDDWFYHVGWGEAHCGTNAKRTPPAENTLAQKWWEVYDPSVDTTYDPADH